MWSLRFPAHYSWITGNPEVILRTLESRVFNFPCLGRQKRVNFPKTRLCYAALASPTISSPSELPTAQLNIFVLMAKFVCPLYVGNI
jgi:hypothetical protein